MVRYLKVHRDRGASCRQIAEHLGKGGIEVTQETVRLWVHRLGVG